MSEKKRLNKSNEILILKLGGSLLTDKNKPFSIRKEVVENTVKQIIKANKKLIIIHGGGSFGHPVAKTYKISKGLNPLIENQILGLAETHDAMNNLNSHVINVFIEERFPVISLQPSSIFIKNGNEIHITSIEPIISALDLGLVPILYGDIILDKHGNFSILSGDRIIVELCKYIKKYNVSKVIFAIEKDGILVIDEKDQNKMKLALELTPSDLNNLNLAALDKKIDVTGGIRGKIESIKQICRLNVPVQIVNGLVDDNILKAITNQKISCTEINIPEKDSQEEISRRKIEHLKLPLKFNVQHSKNYFKYIELIHHPLPEIDLEDVDLTISLFNKKISAPICISAMTGGHPISKKINEILGRAAQQENIIIGVGSQRAGILNPDAQDSFKIVRDVAPDVPIIGNIGIGQVSDAGFKVSDFNECVKMINADIMAIHFNSLHELVQVKGDVSYKNFLNNFKILRESTGIPIIAKEVGAGFDSETAKKLDELGFDGFDVGGAGGTSFAAIEALRNNNFNNEFSRNPAETFRDWGIPTPVSIVNVRKVTQKPIIATGGLRTGIDVAKSIVLGADVGGFAYPFLYSAWKDYKENSLTHTIKEIKTLKKELRSSLWLMNIKNPNELKNNSNKRVILGKLYQWLSS
jgi:isopentenyl-diphosphate delta-isomerase